MQLPLSEHLNKDFFPIVNSIVKIKDIDCLNIDNYSNMLMFDKQNDNDMENDIENLQHNITQDLSFVNVP